MATILCIDDTPEETFGSGLSLQDALVNLYQPEFNVAFKRNGKEGIKEAIDNKDVKLVLLDIDFEGKADGPKIADKLKDIMPELKIIVLTKNDAHGKKIEFGWKPNIVGYFIKKEVNDERKRLFLYNLTKGIINYPNNENWTLKLDTENHKVTLISTDFKCDFKIPRSERLWLLLEACAFNANQYIRSFDIQGFTEITIGTQYPEYINKEVAAINKKVIEKTQWRTWGLLETTVAEKSAAKLVVGHAEIDKDKLPDYIKAKKTQYVTVEAFDLLRNEFEKFKSEVIHRLGHISNNCK